MEKADFFHSHKESLLRDYPGLKERIFLDELKEVDLTLDVQRKLLQGMPFAYIKGKTYFYDREFFINENVFIPRFETELLVEQALKDIGIFSSKGPAVNLESIFGVNTVSYTQETSIMDAVSIVDVCTGVGAIGLSLAQNTKFPINLVMTDLSQEALTFAEMNFKSMQNISSQVEFKLTDRLYGVEAGQKMIVSNPPYIPRSKENDVHAKTKEFGPQNALFLEDNDYDAWFESFFKEAYIRLDPCGVFLMEGHEDKLSHLKDLIESLKFSEVTILKDYTARDRILRARKY